MRLVEDVRHGFLRGCSSLEEVDLSPLVNLRAVGSYFLSGCSSMKWIDLTPLRAIEVLPDSFFYGCSSLEEVDLSPLVNLKLPSESRSLRYCKSLKAIRLGPQQSDSVLPGEFRELVVRVPRAFEEQSAVINQTVH